MLKRDELADEDSCLNRARDDEPLFVLLGRDKAAADTIRYWVARRIELGLNVPGDAHIASAVAMAAEIDRRRRR